MLKLQNKKDLLNKTQYNLETAIMTDNYFITDLDLWVLMTYWKIPCVLFTSGRIKMSNYDINWLYLSRDQDQEKEEDLSFLYEPMVYVRSPTLYQNKYPDYTLIVPMYTATELGTEPGKIGEIMLNSTPNIPNVQSIYTYINNMRLVVPQRGRPKKM